MIPDHYLALGHVGPFRQYPAGNYIIMVARADQLNIPVRKTVPAREYSALGDDGTLAGMLEDIRTGKRAVLLFADWPNFHRWLVALKPMLAPQKTTGQELPRPV